LREFTALGFSWKLHEAPETVGTWEPVAWLARNEYEIQAQVLKCHDRFYWTIGNGDPDSGSVEDTDHAGGIAAASAAVVREMKARIERAERALRGNDWSVLEADIEV
jgi:hypothetical protein